MTKLYLDACCLSRLTDDQSQQRIREEAEAVEHILRLVRGGDAEWISSQALSAEAARNPDAGRRQDAQMLLRFASNVVPLDSEITRRATELELAGYGAFDALHLGCAEFSRVDVLLTTDDVFVRRAQRGLGAPRVRVVNPLSWWREVSG